MLSCRSKAEMKTVLTGKIVHMVDVLTCHLLFYLDVVCTRRCIVEARLLILDTKIELYMHVEPLAGRERRTND